MCVLNFFQIGFASAMIYMLYDILFGFERKGKMPVYAVLSGLLALFTSSVPFLVENAEDADVIKEAVTLFAVMIFPCFFFKGKKKMMLPFFGLLINATFDYAVFMFSSPFEDKTFFISGIIYTVLYAAVCVLLFISKDKIQRDAADMFFESISPAFYIVIVIADVSAYYDVLISKDSSYYVEVSNIIRIVSTALMICGMFYIISKYFSGLHAQKQSELQVNMQVKLYSEMMKKNLDIRRFRHDYKNNLLSLEALIQDGRNDEAIEYISKLGIGLDKTKNSFATGNFLADAILSDKAEKASEKSVEISFYGSIPESGIDNTDLCTVLANSVDNAVRECEKIENAKIMVSSKESSKGVIITVKNPVKNKINISDGKIKTTKSDSENHGFGIPNIRRTSEKYGGYTEVRCDGEFFEIEIGMFYN